MQFFKTFLLLIFILQLSACATEGIFRRELPGSASDLRKAIVTVIGDPRVTSFSGRELLSRFHNKEGTYEEPSKNAKERRFTQISILGDRRPFDIQVEVIIERRSGEGEFVPVATDDAQANDIADRIKKALHQSLDKRNILDDFRAF